MCFWWWGVVVLAKSLHPDHHMGGEGPIPHVMFWRWEKEGTANLDAGFHRNQLPHFLLWLRPKESIFPALPSREQAS